MVAELDRERLRGFPPTLTPMVGRTEERAAVANLLRTSNLPLLTLTGPAGTGKTRLAIAVARELGPEFADGVVFVSLASISDPELVLPTIAQSLGIWQSGDQPLLDLVRETLQPRELLLVLDNLEQVIDATPALSLLLRACPNLRILATSRVTLRLRGEQEYPVPPLGLPEAKASPKLEEIAAAEAVALFVSRARAVNPAFALTEANAAAVLAICRQLDGLPLAIELAAARVKVLSPQALLARLGNRLQVLTGGARDMPARLRSMREAIAWSYDLLDTDERRLFRTLAVFVGGFTLEAAGWVMGDGSWAMEEVDAPSHHPSPITHDPAPDVFDGIASLVDKCLLRQEDRGDGEPRFQMLETIREFGLEQLAQEGEEEAVRGAHAAFFTALTERCHPGSFAGIQRRDLLDVLEAEHDNLRAALTWAVERGRGVDLAGGLGWFWYLRGHLTEGRSWLERALAAAADAPAWARARALLALGELAWEQGDFERAVVCLEQTRAMFDRLGDQAGVAHAVLNLGVVAEKRGDDAAAAALYEEALAISRGIDDRHGIINALVDLGDTAFRQGDLDRAERYTAEALALARRNGDSVFEALGLFNAGQEHLARGRTAPAIAEFKASLRLAQAMGNTWLVADALCGLAGAVAGMDPERGARWLGAARAMCDALGTPGVPHHAQQARSLAAVRAALEPAGFDAAWTLGRASTVEAMAADALEWQAPESSGRADREQGPGPAAAATVDRHGLTERELEVLRLLVDGRSSREIAAELYISPRTASTHVGNILAKLGVNSRSAAVAAAFHYKLV